MKASTVSSRLRNLSRSMSYSSVFIRIDELTRQSFGDTVRTQISASPVLSG